MNLQLQKAFVMLVGFVPEKAEHLPAATYCDTVECAHFGAEVVDLTMCRVYTFVDRVTDKPHQYDYEARIAVCHSCGKGFYNEFYR